MTSPSIRLWQAEVTRVFLSAFILLIPQIPFSVKIIIIMLLDRLDCSSDYYPKKGPMLIKDTRICRTKEYQLADKIGDIFCYTLLWLYYLIYVDSPEILKKYITFWFFVRVIGTILFEKTGEMKWIIFFPNIFIESLLAITILQDLGYTYEEYKDTYIFILFIIIIFKLIIELAMHGSKK